MTTSKQQTAYPLRMPNEIRDALTEKALKSGRSLNAEILVALQRYLAEESVAARSSEDLVDELVRRYGAKIQILIADSKATATTAARRKSPPKRAR